MAKSQSMKAVLLPVAFAMAVLSLAARAQEQPKPGHIKLSASASAEVAPDIALIQLGIVTERKVASDAASENAKTAKAVIEQIKSLEIEPRDIRTLSVTVSPIYDEEKDATGRVFKRTSRGYAARNLLEIRIRRMDRVGNIASQLIDKGANIVGVHFAVSDAEGRLDQLRVRAVQEAARKARLYTEAMGIKLGRVTEIEPEPYLDESAAASMPARRSSDAAPVAIPVEPGMRTLSVRVTVTWALAE